MEESFQENLYFLFDKILDIVYCIYEVLDEVWHGSTYIIESKLSQISLHILRIVDEMKKLSGSDGTNDFRTNLNKVIETTVDLTMSLVGLTAITTSIVQSIADRNRSVSLIIGSIASLIIVHQYAVSAVACLLSRAVKVMNSLDVIHATGIAVLESTIINFILTLQPIVMHNYKEATMTELFHGDLHCELSTQIILSANGLIGNKMIITIHSTATALLNIIEEYAPSPFHVLPDLLEQLNVILLKCGRIKFVKLERYITYAFDGLYDVLHHISYNLDKHIQSSASASTSSFPEPSEPIDVALADVKIFVKRFIHDVTQHISESDTFELTVNLITSTRDLMKSLLDPMNIVIHKSGDEKLRITLVSSLQFIALYSTGLVATPFIAATRSLRNFSAHDKLYLNFSATLSLALIKIEMIFDYAQMQNTTEILQRLYDTFDDLFQDLTHLHDGLDATKKRNTMSAMVNAALNLI